ncbi:MAG: hypothetical protein M3Z08_08655 [Chloroflexota bacterium]|nr:hypothetical protein [Chloroflexota bacterium]
MLLVTNCGGQPGTQPAHIQHPPGRAVLPQATRMPGVSKQVARTPEASTQAFPPVFPAYLKRKTASLSWINGTDCQEGMQAYLATARTNPNAALVGTAWVNPLTGSLMNGYNNCIPGSSSMDNVVQLIHDNGGLAYLTITMSTLGAGAWSARQAADYVVEATRNPAYIASILYEVQGAGYDGVIMDLEGVDSSYPAIQQIFATFNQRVWTALRPLHKWYGIALLHKLSDHDAQYKSDGFENWTLLARAADFLVIMAVDQSEAAPGPSVSLPWLEQLLAYAVQKMPGMLSHIIWELPLYGDSWFWQDHTWKFEHVLTYQAARTLVQQGIPPTLIDRQASDLGSEAPHLVYTASDGTKHAVWYPTAHGLYATIVRFRQILQTLQQVEPAFIVGRLQIAVWWRTTQEPSDFWPLLDTLYR